MFTFSKKDKYRFEGRKEYRCVSDFKVFIFFFEKQYEVALWAMPMLFL